MGQILRFGFPIPEIPEYMDPYEYMCTVFIDSLIETFTDKKYAKISENVAEGGTFLVGFEGRLFSVHSDYQVGESVENFDAVGCGANYALGALHQLKTKKITPKTKLMKALETADYFSAGVTGPYSYVELLDK
jgi:ATP-dependent protease HslVU (ClpYQ) peptidase subunit